MNLSLVPRAMPWALDGLPPLGRQPKPRRRPRNAVSAQPISSDLKTPKTAGETRLAEAIFSRRVALFRREARGRDRQAVLPPGCFPPGQRPGRTRQGRNPKSQPRATPWAFGATRARRALWELRRRHPDAGGRLNELKVRWLEAHIFIGLEELDRAELALRLVKEGYEEAGLPFKAALAGFELGTVLLRQGRFAEATETVLECAGVF